MFIFSSSAFSHGHCHGRVHGNAIGNGLFGFSYSVSAVLTSSEAVAVHDHYAHRHRHRHCWKKQANEVLSEIKAYEQTGVLSEDLLKKLDSADKLKGLSMSAKLSVVKKALEVALKDKK